MDIDGGRGDATAATTGLGRVWPRPGGGVGSRDGGGMAALRGALCRVAEGSRHVAHEVSGRSRALAGAGRAQRETGRREPLHGQEVGVEPACTSRRTLADGTASAGPATDARNNHDINLMKREDGLLWASTRLAGGHRAATGGRSSLGEREGDESENSDINPMNRENGTRPTRARLAGGRCGAIGSPHSLGGGEGDEPENLDIIAMNRENGARPTQARRAGAHHVPRLVAGARSEGVKATSPRISTSML